MSSGLAMAQSDTAVVDMALSPEAKQNRASQLWEEAKQLYEAGKAREAEPLFAEELRLMRELFGDKHPDTLVRLNYYAIVLEALGRSGDAEPLFAESLRLSREVLGPTHENTLSSLNNYAYVLQSLGRDREAEPLYADALRLTRKILGEKHPDTLNSLNNYAFVLQALGRADEAEPLYAEALRLNRKVLGEKHPDTLNSLNNYGYVLQPLGRAKEAEPYFAEALRLRREVLGEKHPDTLSSLNNYALVLDALGRSREAEPLLAEALRLTREVLGEEHPATLGSLVSHATVLESLGRVGEAEPLYAEALRLAQKILGKKHPTTLTTLNNYASVLNNLGRTAEAEPLYAEALRLRREVLGDQHPSTLNSLNNYAYVSQALGHSDQAEPLYAEALRLRRNLWGDKNPDTIASLNNYALVLKSLRRSSEAEPLMAEALRLTRELLGEKHPLTMTSLNNYASVLESLGRVDQAEPLYVEALQLRREVLGERHPDTLDSLNNLSYARVALPSKSHLAVDPARSLVRDIRAVREVAGFTPGEEAQLDRKEKSQSDRFRLFVDAAWMRGPGLLAEARKAGAMPLNANKQAELREEVLTALQDALMGAAGKAISAAIARKAAGPLESLVIEREELSQQWMTTDKALVKALGENVDTGANNRTNLRERLVELEKRMKAIDGRLQNEAPDYFALMRPEALSLAAAQRVLAPDEAALMVVPTNYGTHIMLVSDEGLRWVRSNWTSDRVDGTVKRLLWDVGADVDIDAADAADWADEGTGAYPFAFDSAYALYREMIAPIADGLKSKRHLFISASGSLSSLPFGMLVSEVPAGDSGDPDVLRSAKWFADAYALIQIPSLQSLEFLRKYRPSDGKTAGLPFLGIGDPILTGQSETRGSRRSKLGAQSGSGAFKPMFSASTTRGGASIANISELRKMARLPGTAIELTAMWEEFGRPVNGLHLADQATEDFVRTQNLDANIIAFATHGLLAGDIGGTAEPGIVLTPPLRASESNDGYLSASEIAALKLNADWVILSACNTAAGDGSEGAPGLSGLARSFFYAGARNLLASHWPVRDDVAAKLTVRTISIARDNPQLSRAQAFQQAMREIRNDKRTDSDTDTWAHPSAWAPFSLIGDGAN
jgi:CHAT domain-containing protein/tetratricopeptide (TPR) repeat protein